MLCKILVSISRTENNYCAHAPDLPGCMATGKTYEDVVKRITEALELHIKAMADDGDPGLEIFDSDIDYKTIMVEVPLKKQITGETLRNFRNKKAWTQSDLADKLEVTKEIVSQWERGDTPLPGTVKFALEAIM